VYSTRATWLFKGIQRIKGIFVASLQQTRVNRFELNHFDSCFFNEFNNFQGLSKASDELPKTPCFHKTQTRHPLPSRFRRSLLSLLA
jgi:hypothetical protein